MSCESGELPAAAISSAVHVDADRFLGSILETTRAGAPAPPKRASSTGAPPPEKRRRCHSPVLHPPASRMSPSAAAGESAEPKVITFEPWSKGDIQYLSNAPGGKGQAVTIDGVRFLSEEHAIQYHKFKAAAAVSRSASRQTDLCFYAEMFKGVSSKLRTVEQAKTVGMAMRLARAELQAYYARSVSLQTKICMFKFTQDVVIRNALRKSGDAQLVNLYHGEKTNAIWGACIDDRGRITGKNELGRIWMRIRDAMR